MSSLPFLYYLLFMFLAFGPCEHGPQFWNTKICTRLTISEMLFFRLTHSRFFMVRKLVSWCENCAPRDLSWCENWCHGAKIAHPGAAPRCCTQVPLHPGTAPRYCTEVLHPGTAPPKVLHPQVLHPGTAPRCCTLVLHPGTAPRYPCTQVLHPGAAPRCCTQVLHPGAPPWYCTQVLQRIIMQRKNTDYFFHNVRNEILQMGQTKNPLFLNDRCEKIRTGNRARTVRRQNETPHPVKF